MQTLRIARIKAGFTQEQLANLCDISAVTISNIERGKVSPQDLTRRRLESMLGQIDWLMTEDEALIRTSFTYESESENK